MTDTATIQRAADSYTDGLARALSLGDAFDEEVDAEARRLSAVAFSDPRALIRLESDGDLMVREFKFRQASSTTPGLGRDVTLLEYMLTELAMQMRVRPPSTDEKAIIEAFAKDPSIVARAQANVLERNESQQGDDK